MGAGFSRRLRRNVSANSSNNVWQTVADAGAKPEMRLDLGPLDYLLDLLVAVLLRDLTEPVTPPAEPDVIKSPDE